MPPGCGPGVILWKIMAMTNDHVLTGSVVQQSLHKGLPRLVAPRSSKTALTGCKMVVSTHSRQRSPKVNGWCAAVPAGESNVPNSWSTALRSSRCQDIPGLMTGFRGAAVVGSVLLRDSILKVCCPGLQTGALSEICSTETPVLDSVPKLG